MLVTSIFSFSHSVFPKLSSFGSLKVRIVWYRISPLLPEHCSTFQHRLLHLSHISSLLYTEIIFIYTSSSIPSSATMFLCFSFLMTSYSLICTSLGRRLPACVKTLTATSSPVLCCKQID